jgi:hypothetical protein
MSRNIFKLDYGSSFSFETSHDLNAAITIDGVQYSKFIMDFSLLFQYI